MRLVKQDDLQRHHELQSLGKAKRKCHYEKNGRWKVKNLFRSIGERGHWPLKEFVTSENDTETGYWFVLLGFYFGNAID